MSFYVPGLCDDDRVPDYKKEAVLDEIAKFVYNLSDDEKEGLKILIKKLGKEQKFKRLCAERERIDKELNEFSDHIPEDTADLINIDEEDIVDSMSGFEATI